MATPRKDRGEWRPIYEALYHGKDFRRLSVNAKLLLLTLKGLCGAAGIKAWPVLPESLAELTGMNVAGAKKAVRELVSAEWIEYEDGIVWVRRGLLFEPQLSPENENHCKYVAKAIAGLSSAPILERFRKHYRAYFADHPEGDTQGDQHSHPDSHADSLSGSTPQPQPLPQPQPQPQPPVAAVVRRDHGPHRTALADAANRGITALWGERPTPLRWDSPGAFELTSTLADAGVSLDFAVRWIFTLASTKRPADGKPPASLKYFADATAKAWTVQGRGPSQADNADTAGPDHERAFGVLCAREGHVEWQQWCDERGYVWRAAS